MKPFKVIYTPSDKVNKYDRAKADESLKEGEEYEVKDVFRGFFHDYYLIGKKCHNRCLFTLKSRFKEGELDENFS